MGNNDGMKTARAKTPTCALRAPDPKKLNELVRRIVEVAHPLRVYLFGSAARGEMGPHSDLDVLVVVPDGTPCGRVTDAIYLNMWGFGIPKDILLVTESHLRRHRTNPCLVFKNAIDEGREIYHAAS
jgi:predicted nucleotidyltransferase